MNVHTVHDSISDFHTRASIPTISDIDVIILLPNQ